MRKLLLLIIISISFNINAQYITLDRDGYTNVRTEPNAKSEIAETVKKYQVFYSAADIPCSDDADGRNHFGNWLRITTDMQSVAGYIYTKNIYALEDLPVLTTETRLESDLFYCSNDSIDVRISLQAYSEKNELKNKRAYGTDGFKPHIIGFSNRTKIKNKSYKF